MSRIQEITNATLVTEVVAPNISIVWNPADNSGVVAFQMQRLRTLNGAELPSESAGTLRVSLEDILGRTVNVELPSGGSTPVPMTLVMAAIKAMFNELYLEHHPADGGAPSIFAMSEVTK